QDLHTLAFHSDCVLQLMQRLHVSKARLIVPASLQRLGQALCDQGQIHFTDLEVLPEDLSPLGLDDRLALQAPYPNAGHRSGERAFAADIAN
ncbi:MAG: hypothetical protein ORN28_04030, partial [Rhodoferax sp.]|nr:hypothetical protein [Rhodoferax sp.]